MWNEERESNKCRDHNIINILSLYKYQNQYVHRYQNEKRETARNSIIDKIVEFWGMLRAKRATAKNPITPYTTLTKASVTKNPIVRKFIIINLE